MSRALYQLSYPAEKAHVISQAEWIRLFTDRLADKLRDELLVA
jgi:hypothetical protein